MPVPAFLSQFADKAQSALQSSPLGGRISSGSTGNTAEPSSGSPTRSHTFAAIGHQFRTLQQTYGTTTPFQKIVTASKGVAIDFDSVARDTKASSKEMYMWGQTEAEDLKDGTVDFTGYKCIGG